MIYKDHILVVDDDLTLLEQAEQILSDNYLVSLANSGEQAIKYLKSGHEADLILLDILMPNMDGFQTLKAIQKLEGWMPPVIFLTSVCGIDSEIKGLDIGAADYITKPFSPQVLLARLKARLNTRDRLDYDKLRALPFPLTESEYKVAKLLARSYSNEEIAEDMHYALDTVKKLVSRVLEKLDIKNRKEIKLYLR
ncbi:MAG: response regulator [Acetoanaerobium sp.]|uniref:response regulator transcription factor n=1 Tax=Acetoanaerobium noterae TaxID=745369 RepID=UPI001B56BFEB|nr:response regulator [Acetoanaerobium sp.]